MWKYSSNTHSANSVYAACEVCVSYGCTPGFYWPHRLAGTANERSCCNTCFTSFSCRLCHIRRTMQCHISCDIFLSYIILTPGLVYGRQLQEVPNLRPVSGQVSNFSGKTFSDWFSTINCHKGHIKRERYKLLFLIVIWVFFINILDMIV